MRLAILAMALALVACGPKPAAAPERPAPPEPPNAATLKSATISPEAEPDVGAASVNKVVPLDGADAKLYSTVGGDPAINGEYVFLALMGDPEEDIKVFKVGDFNTWEVVRQTSGRVVLKVSHSAVSEPGGEIVTYVQNIAVTVPAFAASSVEVTPVQ